MTPSVPPPFALTDEAPPLTEEERSLLPSGPDIEFYAEHGWYLSKKLFTDDEVDELLAATERYYAAERDRTLPLRPPKLAYWDPSSDPEFCPVLWRGRTSNGLAHRAQEVGHVSLSLGPAASRNRSP